MNYFFNGVSLFGGLAMFLYGMRLMSSSLKEGQSGTLKVVLEKVTNNPLKAIFLGILVTAIIQSSTATIVITSGLVAAGVLSLHQSMGIIIGANVGTTVTGQIIRLLDIDGGASSVLRFLQPSTLAPFALVAGIILIMFLKFQKSDNIGSILMGFGILFTGLMNMTNSVSSLKGTGIIDAIFTGLGNNPILAYLAGASVAFVLQSSSATIGLLQALAISFKDEMGVGGIPFNVIYIILVGIYLGDCVTTAIVCSIGAKPEAKRVGIVNILFNLSKTVLVLVVVTIVHQFGLIDSLWDRTLTSGGIANTNTVFNLGCAILLFPLVGIYEKIARKIVKDEETVKEKYSDVKTALSPVFFATPALAFRSVYNALLTMFDASRENFRKAMGLVINGFDKAIFDEVEEEEDRIDQLADNVDNYLLQLSSHISDENHIRIMDEYYKLVTEFERLGDHAANIAEAVRDLDKQGIAFSNMARKEMAVAKELLEKILDYTRFAFLKRNADAAQHIEPLEEVVDDIVNAMHDNHIVRLREGKCTIPAGVTFLDLLNNIERISDTCSNVGVATITRIHPEMENQAHKYISSLHQGIDANFNLQYNTAHTKYFALLDEAVAEQS
ncbi:MAG: Na/Pi cotransporter family protein [Lachnospiraceae bacterium]|nr:Na/Pi cotransporter family protein [Lachnospiraceae bacterium]